MRKIREVLRLKVEARLSDEQVAKAICSARSTVQECLRRAREAGLATPLLAIAYAHLQCFEASVG